MQYGLTDQKKKSGLRDSVLCISEDEVRALEVLVREGLSRGRGMSLTYEHASNLLEKLRKREVGLGRLGQFGKQMGLMNVNLSVLGDGPWVIREDAEWYHIEIPEKVEGIFMVKDSEFALAIAAALNAVVRTRWLSRKGEF